MILSELFCTKLVHDATLFKEMVFENLGSFIVAAFTNCAIEYLYCTF